MKIILLSFCLLSFSLHAQFFSGELTYTKKVIAKKPGVNVDSLINDGLGPSMTYLITSQYYKSSYFKNGKLTYSYTYHDDTKRMYDESYDKDYITYRDSRKGNTSMIRSIVYKDSIKNVAGHSCFMTEGVYENYIQKTYYATDLKIDPESFKGHEVGNWYNEIKQVNGALSLMSMTEFANYIEILEVTKITPRVLKPKDFALPDKKIVIASSSALDIQVDLVSPSLASQSCYRKKMSETKIRPGISYTSYVGFIVSDAGKLSHIEPYEKDENAYYKVAVDIISTCGFEFTPGQIGGKEVSSWVYFPIEFNQ